MDINLISAVSLLWRDGYYDKIPSELFYKLLVDIVPKTDKQLFWIKKQNKTNQKLIELISTWYSVSYREAEDYIDILTADDSGMKELSWILEGMGLTDNEAEKILSHNEE